MGILAPFSRFFEGVRPNTQFTCKSSFSLRNTRQNRYFDSFFRDFWPIFPLHSTHSSSHSTGGASLRYTQPTTYYQQPSVAFFLFMWGETTFPPTPPFLFVPNKFETFSSKVYIFVPKITTFSLICCCWLRASLASKSKICKDFVLKIKM